LVGMWRLLNAESTGLCDAQSGDRKEMLLRAV